jgi:ribosomal protein L37E
MHAAVFGVEPLDGNSIAGDLFNLFGREMTTVAGACRHCGAVALIAELRVYSRAPGAVVRCRRCGQVVFVVVDMRGETRINLDQFALE